MFCFSFFSFYALSTLSSYDWILIKKSCCLFSILSSNRSIDCMLACSFFICTFSFLFNYFNQIENNLHKKQLIQNEKRWKKKKKDLFDLLSMLSALLFGSYLTLKALVHFCHSFFCFPNSKWCFELRFCSSFINYEHFLRFFFSLFPYFFLLLFYLSLFSHLFYFCFCSISFLCFSWLLSSSLIPQAFQAKNKQNQKLKRTSLLVCISTCASKFTKNVLILISRITFSFFSFWFF